MGAAVMSLHVLPLLVLGWSVTCGIVPFVVHCIVVVSPTTNICPTPPSGAVRSRAPAMANGFETDERPGLPDGEMRIFTLEEIASGTRHAKLPPFGPVGSLVAGSAAPLSMGCHEAPPSVEYSRFTELKAPVFVQLTAWFWPTRNNRTAVPGSATAMPVTSK